MASEIKVNKISPESGTTLTLGDSGDTINFGSGVLPNFENLTVTGDLTVDTNSLKVDSANNFVGIGTASPSVALDVVGAITATGNITGTLATAAQPNITSVGTLTSFTSTGIDDNASSTAMTISSSGVVSIGTTSSSGGWSVKVAGSNAPLELARTAGDTVERSQLGMEREGTFVGQFKSDATNLWLEASTGALIINTGGGTERMRIDSSGNVGIGNTVASTINSANGTGNLVVGSGSGTEGITIYSGTTGEGTLQFADGTSGAATYVGQINYNHSSNFMSFGANASERMRIDSSGNVGIGTTSPQEKLDIDGNIAISGNTLFEEVTSGAGMPSSGGNKSVNTAYDSTFSLTAGKWLILVNASLQVFQTSGNESGLYLLSLSLGSSAGADNYGLIQKAVLKWGNGSNSYGDNTGGHFPTLTLGSTTTLHTRWYVAEYGTASNFWVRGNLTRIRCIRIG